MFALRNATISQLRSISTRSALCSNVKSSELSNVDVQPKHVYKQRNNEKGRVTEDGGQVFQGFTYYPRQPGQQDPPYEPTKVLMVQRIHTLKNRPYWEKDICSRLGLSMDKKPSEVVVVPNTPSTCAKLWQVKHLVRITPVAFPQGLPENGDLTGARLQDNGELRFIPKLKSDAESIPVTLPRDHMDGETLKKHLRLKWIKPFN